MACSQKDMASPFIVDRHKFQVLAFMCFLQSPCALCGLLVLACLSLVLARYRVATYMCLYRAHVLFVASWFLLAFRMFLHFVALPLLGQGGVLPFALAIVPWKFSFCGVLSSCCW